MQTIRTLSLFSGCGGLDLGFHDAGFEILAANEIEKEFCDSIEANKGSFLSNNLEVINKDIRLLDPKTLPNDIDFIIGGPPCQSFSASGRRAGGAAGKQDDRGNLFESYGKIIKAKKPHGFLFENVRGILSSNKGKDWEDIKEYFSNLGYKLDYRVLDACDYGVAQHRERLILVGHKMSESFEFPRPIYGPDSRSNQEHLSAKHAFKGIRHDEKMHDLEFVGGKYSHLLAEVPEGGNYLFFTEKRGYPNPIFAYRSRFSDFLYKADSKQPTKTIIASPGKYTGPLHWKNRYFSVSEYKRLQGIPDKYKILGNRSTRIKQIGNSVSPPMAFYLANSVKAQLFKSIEQDAPEAFELIGPAVKLSFDKRKGKKAQDTRDMHLSIVSNRSPSSKKFSTSEYECEIFPNEFKRETNNVKLRQADGRRWNLEVRTDSSRKLFAKTILQLGKKTNNENSLDYEIELAVTVYGRGDYSIQTMWNAIDDFVIKTSNFHSLYEIYGHFTEPHPDFRISTFKGFSDHPMFDVRSKEINIAIDKNEYMISYPFTLPKRKQMNFKAKELLSV